MEAGEFYKFVYSSVINEIEKIDSSCHFNHILRAGRGKARFSASFIIPMTSALLTIAWIIALSVAAPTAAVFFTAATNAATSPAPDGGRLEHFLNGPDLAILALVQYGIIDASGRHLSPWVSICGAGCLVAAILDKRWAMHDAHPSRPLPLGKALSLRHVLLHNGIGLFPLLAICLGLWVDFQLN